MMVLDVKSRGGGQRKIASHWDGVPIQKVKKLPEGINGLCCYRISCDINDVKSRVASLKDGRSWKKDSRTEWAGYGRVRYANCKGSYRYANNNCMYLVEYGQRVDTMKREMFSQKSVRRFVGDSSAFVMGAMFLASALKRSISPRY